MVIGKLRALDLRSKARSSRIMAIEVAGTEEKIGLAGNKGLHSSRFSRRNKRSPGHKEKGQWAVDKWEMTD